MARGIELATGYVSLTAETSTLAKQVSGIFKGADTQASTAGRSMGKAMAKGFDVAKPNVDALAAEVTRAEQRVAAQAEASAKKQEAAKRKVEIAQAKLNEATEKFGSKSSQALTAVDRLATSEQKLESETLQAADAQNKLQSELKQSKDALSTASKSSEKASKVYAKGWKGVGQRVKGYLKGGVKQATDVAEDQAERGGKEAGGGFSSAFKGAIGGLVAGFSVAAVVGGIREVSDAAGAAEQSVGAIDSVFKGNSGAMHEWSKSAATAVGISGNEYRELGTLIGAQLKNAKTPMDELAGKTNDLITTGADLSSMFGGSTKEAVEALSSALKGEMDPIEKYGITLNEAALKSIALEKGLIESEVDAGKVSERTQKMALAQDKYNAAVSKYGKGSTQAKGAALALTSAENLLKDAQAGKVPSLDAATKAQAVQLAVAQQSADAQGNFAREEDTYEHKRQVAIASWQDMKEKIGGAFLPALAGAMGFVSDTAIPAIGALTDGLKSAVGWVKENSTWLIPLTVAVGGYVLALAGLAIVSKMKTLMAGLTAGQWLLNVAMSANPIGILVALIAGLVAAVVVLYKNNETARRIIDGAWIGIKTSIQVAWDWIKSAFGAIKTWITVTLPAGFGTLKTKSAEAWQGIKDKIGAVWLGIKGFFVSIRDWFTVTLPGAWNKLKEVNSAVWGGIKSSISGKWEAIKGVFGSIRDYLRNTLGPAFSWLKDNIVTPVFNGIKRIISNVWNDGIKPVFDTIKQVLKGDFVGAFQTAKDAVGRIWSKVANVVRKPINFVIGTVYNQGIKKVFDKVAGIVGIKALPNASEIPAFAKGGEMGKGWKLVGEEGPELINTGPGFVHTAGETKKMLAGKKQMPMGAIEQDTNPIQAHAGIGGFGDLLGAAGRGLKDAWKASTDWIRGGLAAAAKPVVDFIKRQVTGSLGISGFGGMAGGAANTLLDGALKFLRGKDDDMPADGSGFGNGTGGSFGGGYDGPLGRFFRPNGQITSGFGASRGAYPHAGIDFAVPIGTAVKAMFDGVVRKNGWNAVAGRSGKGQIIDHGQGYSSYTGHLSGWTKQPGAKVKAGETTALSGNTGRSTGPHAHRELWKNGKPFNFASYLHDDGGVHEPGTWSYNGLKKPEAVLNPRQWDIAASAVDNASNGFASKDIDRLIHAVNDLANRPVDASLRIGQREFDGAVFDSRKRSERLGVR